MSSKDFFRWDQLKEMVEDLDVTSLRHKGIDRVVSLMGAKRESFFLSNCVGICHANQTMAKTGGGEVIDAGTIFGMFLQFLL